MRMVTIWMAEDSVPDQSGFGTTQEQAERFITENRAYDHGNGGYTQAIKDEWAKPAVKIKVPAAVAAVLIESNRRA